jgi:molybdate transport system substrate-binding protein
MKKKLLAIGLSLTMVLAVTACGSTSSGGGTSAKSDSASAAAEKVSGDLYVSAAASMTESLDKVIEKFEKQNPDCKVTPTYDSSGTLETQIIQGASCDVFISAAQKQMDELDGSSDKCLGENYVLSGSRIDLLENTAVLVVSKDMESEISSWDDFVEKLNSAQSDEDLIFCMGNSDVPVGAYTSKILQGLGIQESDLVSKGIVTYGTNVKEVTSQVQSGAADCGIIYSTDAYSANMTPVATADAALAGQIIYPAAVMQNAENQEAAKAFVEFLKTEDAMKEFTAVGFKAV